MTHEEREVIRRAGVLARSTRAGAGGLSEAAVRDLDALRRAVARNEAAPEPKVLVVEYDVTHLTEAQLNLLIGEAEAQAERTKSSGYYVEGVWVEDEGKPDVRCRSWVVDGKFDLLGPTAPGNVRGVC